MRTISISIYKFDELSKEAQEKAIEKLWDINVYGHPWWQFVYEDAEMIGLKITDFDEHECNGRFIEGAEETALLIKENHGHSCKTYKTAAEYLKKRAIEIVRSKLKGEEPEECLEELDNEFLCLLLEDYRIILKNEYEHLISRESVIETILANEYEFTEDGTPVW